MNSVIENIIGTLERDEEPAELRIQAALELAYVAEQRLYALAAYVERLVPLIEACLESDSDFLSEWDTEARQVLSDTPETSYAKMKAQWVEETLKALPYKELHTNNGDLREDARYRDGWNTFRDHLRRQAEETK